MLVPRWPQGKAAKKGKTAAGCEEKTVGSDGEDEKPAYVHVRAERGNTTDSHSLATRASLRSIPVCATDTQAISSSFRCQPFSAAPCLHSPAMSSSASPESGRLIAYRWG
ncbi:hypothetical protein ACP70R_047299 [Stipagrostis hirtigluma subsp. patula]